MYTSKTIEVKQVDDDTTIILTPTHQPQQRRRQVPPERLAGREREQQRAEETGCVWACEGSVGSSAGYARACGCGESRRKST